MASLFSVPPKILNRNKSHSHSQTMKPCSKFSDSYVIVILVVCALAFLICKQCFVLNFFSVFQCFDHFGSCVCMFMDPSSSFALFFCMYRLLSQVLNSGSCHELIVVMETSKNTLVWSQLKSWTSI